MDGPEEKLIDGLPPEFYCLNKRRVRRWIRLLAGRQSLCSFLLKQLADTRDAQPQIIHHNKSFNHLFSPVNVGASG